jgi:hypothetical protein
MSTTPGIARRMIEISRDLRHLLKSKDGEQITVPFAACIISLGSFAYIVHMQCEIIAQAFRRGASQKDFNEAVRKAKAFCHNATADLEDVARDPFADPIALSIIAQVKTIASRELDK